MEMEKKLNTSSYFISNPSSRKTDMSKKFIYSKVALIDYVDFITKNTLTWKQIIINLGRNPLGFGEVEFPSLETRMVQL